MLVNPSRYLHIKDRFDSLEKAPNNQEWTATLNQDTFTITNGSYTVGAKTLQVEVGGIPQPPSEITELTSTSFKLSEGVPLGTRVVAHWLEGKIPVVFNHNLTHRAGGQDELDLYLLKNGNAVKERMKKYVSVTEFGAKGDGTDDTKAIQDGIDSINLNGGGVLFFPPGTYYVPSNKTLYLKSKVSIVGHHRLTTKITTDPIYNAGAAHLMKVDADDVLLKSISISGGRLETDLTSSNSRYTVITNDQNGSHKNIFIDDCIISDSHGKGIMIQGDNVKITNTTVTRVANTESVNISSLNAGIDLDKSNYVVIDKCTVTNCGSYLVGLYLCNHVKVVDSYFENSSYIGCGNGDCNDLLYQGNTFKNTQDNGLDMQQSNNCRVIGNHFINAGDGHVSSTDGGGRSAIFWGDDSGNHECNGLIIEANTIEGTYTDASAGTLTEYSRYQGSGIFISSGEDVTITNNIIRKIGNVNASRGTYWRNDADGIGIALVSYLKDVRVSGNKITGCKRFGIYTSASLYHVDILDNYINGANESGMHIQVSNHGAVNIKGNNVMNVKRVTSGTGSGTSASIKYHMVNNLWFTHVQIDNNLIYNEGRETYTLVNADTGLDYGIRLTSGSTYAMFNNASISNNRFSGMHQDKAISFQDVYTLYAARVEHLKDNRYGHADNASAQDVVPDTNMQFIIRKFASALPTYGAYGKGSTIYLTTVAPGGYMGSVCTTGGTVNSNSWTASKAYVVGDIVNNGTNVYKCTVAGTSSTTSPSHTTGTATDGTVTWQYINPLAVFKSFGTVVS